MDKELYKYEIFLKNNEYKEDTLTICYNIRNMMIRKFNKYNKRIELTPNNILKVSFHNRKMDELNKIIDNSIENMLYFGGFSIE